ncbi:helix-turn-helix domain-containing protein, partial [Fretibacterium fastidiosum]
MARKRKDWIQTQLAEALGVSVDTVRRWEQGKRIPDTDML